MKQVNAFTFNQTVKIDGILGRVDFIGEDVTVLVDSENKSHIIQNSSIKEAYSFDTIRSKDDSVYHIN